MNEDKVIEMLLKQETRINDLETGLKSYVDARFDDISITLDKIVGLVQKRDEEATFQTYRIRENTEYCKFIAKK